MGTGKEREMDLERRPPTAPAREDEDLERPPVEGLALDAAHHPRAAADAGWLSDTPFRDFLMGGFECSNHVLEDGRRLDLLASTRHDELAETDYRRMLDAGMTIARDGIRWHRIEPTRGTWDLASARPMVRAARRTGIHVIWDLLHFGWPDHVDPFAPDFPQRLAELALRFAELLAEVGDPAPAVAPVNEISFFSFAGGEAGFFNPFQHRRGDELKVQLVRAALAAGRAVRSVLPRARLLHTDPIIHVVARPDRPRDRAAAEAHEGAQYHAWDMISGRRAPELGGTPEDLDVLGLNYYIHNQWFYPGGHGSMIPPSSAHSRPVHHLIVEACARYRRPAIIAETGIEDAARAPWLAFMMHEARAALRAGADLRGLCLYPIVNHPGWSDDRHCHNGLWDYADARGERVADPALAAELARQRSLMAGFDPLRPGDEPAPDLARLDPIAETIAKATETDREGAARGRGRAGKD